MLYYKVLDSDGSILGAVTIEDFRFYHAKRQRMFMTQNSKRPINILNIHIILDDSYYKVVWLQEDPCNQGKYPVVNLILIDENEYKKYVK